MSCQNDSQCQNGGLCGLHDVRNGSCNCNAGWTGEHCESKTFQTSYSAVAVSCGEGGCLSACWDTPPGCGPGDHPGCGPGDPQVWAWRPPWPDPSTSPLGVGLETPPLQPDPSSSTLGFGLETCKACWDTPPTPARHAEMPPARHAGIPPPHPWTEFLTHASENITLPQLRCGR